MQFKDKGFKVCSTYCTFIIVVKCFHLQGRFCKFEGCFNDLDSAIVHDDKMKNKCKYDLYLFYLTKTCLQLKYMYYLC